MPEYGRLAIDGGTPLCGEPWPSTMLGPAAVGQPEIDAVTAVLRSQKLFRFLDPATSRCAELEARFRALTGQDYALAVGGGTAALVCGLTGIGISEGDEVIVPAYTYIATPAAVLICGGVPVIAEIDETLTLDPARIEECITERTRAIVPVHMRGYPCDMARIMAVAERHGLDVLEDVAQACGGSCQGRRLGSFGRAGCFSLQQFKIITAGEGGMVVTSDETVFQRAALRHDSAMHFWQPAEGGVPPFPGENFRMNEMEGALGCAQFERLEGILARCRELCGRVRDGIADVDAFRVHRSADPDGECGISLTLLFGEGGQAQRFSEALRAEGIPCGSLYDKGIPDRHVFCYWDYVMRRSSQDRHGRPWTSPLHDQSRRYAPDMCPRTLDVLGRSVILSFSQTYEDRHAELMAAGIRKVAAGLS